MKIAREEVGTYMDSLMNISGEDILKIAARDFKERFKGATQVDEEVLNEIFFYAVVEFVKKNSVVNHA